MSKQQLIPTDPTNAETRSFFNVQRRCCASQLRNEAFIIPSLCRLGKRPELTQIAVIIEPWVLLELGHKL